MNPRDLSSSLATLLSELIGGAPRTGAYMLNRSDPGMLSSLERISAEAASRVPDGGGASIAAHVEHVRYGISLMNRWAAGEDPFADASWSASWRRQTVDEAEWAELRESFAKEAHAWLAHLGTPREASAAELNEMIGSIAHLAYHLGAIRQIDRTLRGPAAND